MHNLTVAQERTAPRPRASVACLPRLASGAMRTLGADSFDVVLATISRLSRQLDTAGKFPEGLKRTNKRQFVALLPRRL